MFCSRILLAATISRSPSRIGALIKRKQYLLIDHRRHSSEAVGAEALCTFLAHFWYILVKKILKCISLGAWTKNECLGKGLCGSIGTTPQEECGIMYKSAICEFTQDHILALEGVYRWNTEAAYGQEPSPQKELVFWNSVSANLLIFMCANNAASSSYVRSDKGQRPLFSDLMKYLRTEQN